MLLHCKAKSPPITLCVSAPPSTFLYLKFLVVWALVLLADFVLEFRFEYLWPFWLFIRSVYDSFRYQGLVSVSVCVCLCVCLCLQQVGPDG